MHGSPARFAAALVAAALAWPAGVAIAAEPARAPVPAAATQSVVALQGEFIRRVNHAEPAADLFDPRMKAPDLGGLRAIRLLQAAMSSPARSDKGTDTAHARLHVRVRLQSQFTTDCPAVDAYLAQTGELVREWEEQGWMEIDYLRTADGWRISGLEFQADKQQP